MNSSGNSFGKMTSLSDSSSDDDSMQVYQPQKKKMKQEFEEKSTPRIHPSIKQERDSSSDEGPASYNRPTKKFKKEHEETGSRSNSSMQLGRSTVIMNPSYSHGFQQKYEAASTSQDSECSDDGFGSSTLNIHQAFMKPKSTAAPVIDQKAKAMMAKMGWSKGTGLGKKSQGMVQPIEVSKQRGRRGLGLQIKGLEAEEVEWDSSGEIVEVDEVVSWCPSEDLPALTITELNSFRREGPKKTTIDDETTFCDSDTLLQVLQCKTIFDELEEEELRKARSRSNPFETIRGAFFLNRAAMKMANLDAVFGFMFTDPRNEDETPFVPPNELLYFADVCAGPGGFSEYVLWRKKWKSKGFGFTLKGSNDFKLEDFFAAPSECFEPHYGVGGIDGDGDVYNPKNIREFQRFVFAQTEGKGVHFMMADGGFSVEGQENLQEILSKRLYLCQFLVALSIVRSGGHFVCKVFDLFTPFSAGLVYLLYRSFKQICIHKPNTSRPANSERYIICKWKRTDTQAIQDYLFATNIRLQELDGSKSDILDIVPLELMTTNPNFYNYFCESNNVLGMRQVVNLAKIAAFCKDVTLREDRQSELKKQSLEFWNVPDKARTAPPRRMPAERCKELLSIHSSVLDDKACKLLNSDMLREKITSVYEWRCAVIGLEEENPLQTFFLSLGRNHVFYWDQKRSRWQKLSEQVELIRDTLVYAELVQELRGEGRSQMRSNALHIIDAIYLGGEDVSHFQMEERYQKILQYSKAITRASRNNLVIVRAKEQFELDDISQIFHRLSPRLIKNSGSQERLVFHLNSADHRAFLPSGILFYKTVKNSWTIAYSKSQKKNYWFNVKKGTSVFDCPPDAIANTYDCSLSRLVWWCGNGIPEFNMNEAETGILSKDDVISFVHSKIKI